MNPCKIYPYQINATIDETSQPLQLMSPSETRIIVGTSINTSNQVEKIIQSFQENFQGMHYKLNYCTLGLQ